MKEKFAPYLQSILPGVFAMAALNPEMGVSGGDKLANIVDVLSEVHTEEGKDSKINLHTDELEEKDVAIQMLSVFIDECGAGFAPYIEKTSEILLAMLEYSANDDIRDSTASTLPGLCKCAK